MYHAKSYVHIMKKIYTSLTICFFQIVIDEINLREFDNLMQRIKHNAI